LKAEHDAETKKLIRRLKVEQDKVAEEQEENQPEDGFHQLGARTCIARLSDLSGHGLLDDAMSSCSTDMSDESTPSVLHSEISGLSSEAFASTPTGSECDFYPEKIDTPKTSSVSASLCSSGRQLLVQIPVDACSSGETSPDVNVVFSNVTVDPHSGSTVVDLRLVLGRQLAAAPVPPPPTSVSLSQLLVASPGNSSATTSSAGEKSDKVCCHWKNKGWCKYATTCKFQHPAHKQGVGKAQKASANLLVNACRVGN